MCMTFNLPSFADSYEVHARYYPVIALGLTIMLTVSFLEIEMSYADALPDIPQWLISILGVVLLVFVSPVFAKIGKIIERLYFKKYSMSYYPTTKILVEKEASTSLIRDSTIKTIKQIYGVDLLKQKKNRKVRIAEVNQTVAMIRMDIGQEKMVLRANRNYGSFRNLLACIIVYGLFVLGLVIYNYINPIFPWDKLSYLSIGALAMAVVIWYQMRKAAGEYAHSLFNAFIVKYKNNHINE